MRYLSLSEVLQLHKQVVAQSGGAEGLADQGLLESAVVQPQMTFAGRDLYPTMEEKAGALGFSLIANHPFLDGNKRIGHAAMETFLLLNGFEINASVDEQERFIFSVAAGEVDRAEFTQWVRDHIQSREHK